MMWHLGEKTQPTNQKKKVIKISLIQNSLIPYPEFQLIKLDKQDIYPSQFVSSGSLATADSNDSRVIVG